MRILICDDHAVVRAGLRLILEQEAGFEIVGEAASGEELIAEASRLRPDIVVTDLSMPGLGGLEALPRMRQAAPVETISASPAALTCGKTCSAPTRIESA